MTEHRVNRRSGVTVMLYVGVAAMAMITWFDYRAKQGEEDPLRILDVADVRELVVHLPGHQSTVLQRATDAWRITQPIARQAVGTRVDALLRLSQLDPEAAYALADVNPDELGLTRPTATVVFSTAEHAIEFLFGGSGPQQRRRYVQVDERVWLLDDVFLPLIQGGLGALAAHDVLPDDTRVERLRFDGEGIQEPGLAKAWSNVQAAGVEAVDTDALGAMRPLTVVTDTGQEYRFALYARGDTYALVPEAANFALLLTVEQLRALGVPL